MLDTGLVSVWGGLLLLSQSPFKHLSGLVKSVVFFLFWIGFWYSISLVFSGVSQDYRPNEDYISLIERSINVSFSVFAFALAWGLMAFGFKKTPSFKPRAILLWLTNLTLWKLLIFSPVYSAEAPHVLVLGVSLALTVVFTISQMRSSSKP